MSRIFPSLPRERRSGRPGEWPARRPDLPSHGGAVLDGGGELAGRAELSEAIARYRGMDMRFWREKAEREAAVSGAGRATSGSLGGATDHPRRDAAAEGTASA